MSRILKLEGIFRGVAKGFYSGAKFFSGTPDTVAQVRLNRDDVLVALYQGYSFQEGDNDSYTAQNVGWFIGLRDNYSAKKPEYTINAIASAEILMEQFNEALKALESTESISFGDFNLAPQFKNNQELVSGIWCQANIIFAGCETTNYPNLEHYIGEISRKISPADWVPYNPESMKL